MRNITPKDKRGLLVALRVFVRAMNGERIPGNAGEALVSKALAEGLTIDEILNRGNWARALSQVPELSAAEYIDALCERRIDVLELKDEPGWHDAESGWRTVAEAAHDFYMEVTGKGGKWNIPSALTNLAKAVDAHSLQAILSEELIFAVTSTEDPATYFDYVHAIAKDFNTLPVDDSLTEEQQRRRDQIESILNDHEEETTEEDTDPENEEPGHSPEDDPFPEYSDMFNTSLLTPDPTDHKRRSIQSFIAGCSMTEISGLAKTMENGESLSLSEFIENLTRGRFDTNLETPEIRKIHLSLNGDLMDSFTECLQMQGFNPESFMKREDMRDLDLLKDSWDFRDPSVRKLHKLKKLILDYASEDEDLQDALEDLEEFYGE